MMSFRIKSLVAGLCLMAAPVFAGCSGVDLRPGLSDEFRTELTNAVRNVPFGEGNHWRADRGDDVIHLIGTMHLADPRFEGPLQRLRPLIEGASAVMLEMTAAEKADLTAALTSRPDMLLLEGTTLPEMLDGPTWNALSEAVEARGLPAFMAARFQPWYVSMLLAVPPCVGLDALGAGGLDELVMQLADAAGVATIALEPFDTVFSVFGQAPLDV